MKTIYSGIFFALLVIISSSFTSEEAKEIHLKDAGLSIAFPNDKWEEHKEKKDHRIVYKFVRTDVKVSTEKKLVPEIVIAADHLNSYVDLTKYSLQKQKRFAGLKDYKVDKVFTESDGMLKLQYAIGNKARYTDPDGVKHTFYFIHAVRKGKGAEIIIDIPTYLFDSYEEELVSIISSLKYLH